MIGIFVVSAAVLLLGRRFAYGWRVGGGADGGGRAALPVWAVAAVAVVAVGVVQLYLIGDSGAKSVWGNALQH